MWSGLLQCFISWPGSWLRVHFVVIDWAVFYTTAKMLKNKWLNNWYSRVKKDPEWLRYNLLPWIFQMGVLGSPSEIHLLLQRIKKIDLWSPVSFQLWHFMQKLEMKGLYFMCFLRLPYIFSQAKFQLFAVSKSDQSSEILCLKAT